MTNQEWIELKPNDYVCSKTKTIILKIIENNISYIKTNRGPIATKYLWTKLSDLDKMKLL